MDVVGNVGEEVGWNVVGRRVLGTFVGWSVVGATVVGDVGLLEG